MGLRGGGISSVEFSAPSICCQTASDRRVRDGSITYDRFDVGEDRIEYHISKCVYIEMFEAYGIRGLCRIFCMTDTTSYEHLRRHVTFIRHSDLSDGEECYDEIVRRRKPQ